MEQSTWIVSTLMSCLQLDSSVVLCLIPLSLIRHSVLSSVSWYMSLPIFNMKALCYSPWKCCKCCLWHTQPHPVWILSHSDLHHGVEFSSGCTCECQCSVDWTWSNSYWIYHYLHVEISHTIYYHHWYHNIVTFWGLHLYCEHWEWISGVCEDQHYD